MKALEFFLVGAFAAIGALLLEIIIDSLGYQFGVLDWDLSFLAAFALIEELAKFIVIRKKIDFSISLKTAFANCFWIGLGFGFLELGILLLNENTLYAGNTQAIMTVILVHVITTLLICLTLAKLKFNGYYAVLAVVPALIVHLAFNYWVLVR